MSLKTFHLIFITIATLFAIWFAIWGIQSFIHDGTNELYLFLGVLSSIAAIALIVYEVKVFRKFKAL
jgi:hypothetical protein